MAKMRVLLVGSGWRSLFYVRIAHALPERFEICAMLCRSREKAEKMAVRYGIPTSISIDECMAMKPDFVVVAVTKTSLMSVTEAWLTAGFPVLCETPAALTEEGLHRLWELHQSGARLQVAEQYWRYPHIAAQLRLVTDGILGEPDFARISLAHGYHGASLARKFLGAGNGSVRISGRAFPVRIVETDSRWGKVTGGLLAEKILQRHTLEFEGGKTAFLDFCDVQYHTFLRTTHLNIQGPRGELDDDVVRYLNSDGEAVLNRLKIIKGSSVRQINLGDKILYRNPFPETGLGEDEIAIATLMDGMEQFISQGIEMYSLADALQDAYIGILMDRALQSSGMVIDGEQQPWS